MNQTKNKHRLFSEFQAPTSSDWEAQLTKDLKGADYQKTLFTKTREGFDIKPFYRREELKDTQLSDALPGEFPFLRGSKKNNDWQVRQDIMVDSIEHANKKAIELTAKGVNSIGFMFSDQFQPSVHDIERLMENIHSEELEINFLCGAASHKIISIYQELVERYKRDAERIQVSVDFDPFMAFAFRGKFCQTEDYAFTHAKQLVYAAKALPNSRVLAVNSYTLRNAGATIVQELAFALSQGVQYLDKLSDLGLSAEKVVPRIKFNMGVGSNYFMEIAKLRAARYLWAKIVSAFLPDSPELGRMKIHSQSVSWNKSVYDAQVNMLRTTTEGMSAVLGGTDSLCLMPYNMPYQLPNDFSERIARNQQLLFKEESFLDKVSDPAAGSYYIENLTNNLVRKAWNLFLQVEEKGGYINALREGFVQEAIEEAAQKSLQNMATRREIVLGSNQYPNFTESFDEMLNPDVFEAFDLTVPHPEVKTLKQQRLSQQIEKIRSKTDQYAQDNPRPKAYMLPLGNKTMRKARAQFACNYFACAGFEVEDNNGFDDVKEGIQAAIDSKADIVVICSRDDEYPQFVEEVFDALQYHAILVVAGYPAPYLDELKSIGVEHFIHVKSNIVEELKKYQEELGVE